MEINPFTPLMQLKAYNRVSSEDIDVTLNSVFELNVGVSEYPFIINVVFIPVPSVNFKTEVSEGVTCFDP